MSLMTSYLLILILFCAPLPLTFFVKVFVDPVDRVSDETASSATRITTRESNSIGDWIHFVGMSSPFAAAFSVPLSRDDAFSLGRQIGDPLFPQNWMFVAGYFAWSFLLISTLSVSMIWLFNMRWRVSQ